MASFFLPKALPEAPGVSTEPLGLSIIAGRLLTEHRKVPTELRQHFLESRKGLRRFRETSGTPGLKHRSLRSKHGNSVLKILCLALKLRSPMPKPLRGLSKPE